jgi:hypothetical protein
MKRIILLISTIFVVSRISFSQSAPAAFGVKFSGFIRSDIFMDTHENVIMREGLIDLYPEAPLYDANHKDLYEKINYNFLCISTRLRTHINGPDALGAKTTGLIEMEFFGTSENDINGFRMRHAHVNLNWKNTELRIGQAWHPMFIPECYPQTIAFGTGSPFNVFNRSPQIRVTHEMQRVILVAAVLTERDFQSRGPDPGDPSKIITSTQFIRNSGLPELQLIGKFKLDSAGNNMVGGGIGTKSMKPEIYTIGTNNQKTKSPAIVRSFSGFGFLKMAYKAFEARLTGIYCQNAYDLTLLGGYALKEIKDTVTGEKTFTPITTLSLWGDFQWVGKQWKTGVLLGYTFNLGAPSELMHPVYYSRGHNIAYIYRAAPRIIYTSGKFELSFELEYTVAAYGTANSKGRVDNTQEVKNIRPLLTTAYNF